MNRCSYEISQYIQAKKDDIIAMRDKGFSLQAIADKYGVSESAISNNLFKWKFFANKQKKSEWLKARQAENTRINNKYIKFVEFKHIKGR